MTNFEQAGNSIEQNKEELNTFPITDAVNFLTQEFSSQKSDFINPDTGDVLSNVESETYQFFELHADTLSQDELAIIQINQWEDDCYGSGGKIVFKQDGDRVIAEGVDGDGDDLDEEIITKVNQFLDSINSKE